MGISIIRESPSPDRGFSRRYAVEIILTEARAKSVYLLCSIDGFSRRTHPMEKHGEVWRIVLRLLAGEHEYAFLIDGARLATDPENPEVRKNAEGIEVNVMKFGAPSSPTSRADGSVDYDSLYHDQYLPFLEVFRQEAIFRLRTAREDVERVYLIPKDGKLVPMDWVSCDGYFDYFECRLPVAFSLDYGFKVVDGVKEVFIGSEGPADSLLDCKPFPFPPRRMPTHDCPDWALGCVYYQILLDSFRNGDPLNDPKGVLPWGKPAIRDGHFGGDLAGIFQAVPYLRQLGITAVRLMPVFLSPSSDNFDVFDYYHVDLHLGTDEMFGEVVEAFHKEGIRVVQDMVFNHTGRGFFAFRDIVRNQESSQYVNWYTVYDFPIARKLSLAARILSVVARAPQRPPYEAHMDRREWPELNFRSYEVRGFVKDIVIHWIKKANLDGIWLLVAQGIPHNFAAEVRRTIKRAKPDAVLVGDVKTDPVSWLHSEEFDAATDFSFRNAISEYFLRGVTLPSEFAAQLTQSKGLMPWSAVLSKCNQIGDEFSARPVTASEGDKARAMMAAIFQLTYPGSPVIFYGDELGLEGGPYPDCRGSMVWDENRRDDEMLDLYRRLIKVRTDSEALRVGWFKFTAIDDQTDLVAFQRWTEKDIAVVVIRRSGDPQVVEVPLPDGTYRDAISWEVFSVSGGLFKAELSGGSCLVLIQEKPFYQGATGPFEFARL